VLVAGDLVLAQVVAGAERAARAGQDNGPDLVVCSGRLSVSSRTGPSVSQVMAWNCLS
jgi:hypothetical protein